MASSPIEDLEARASGLVKKVKKIDKFNKASSMSRDIFSGLKNLPKSIWLNQVSVEGEGGISAVQGDGSSVAKQKSYPRIILRGYCYTGDATEETKKINEWAQYLAQAPGFSKRFPHLSVDEVIQEKIAGLNASRFILTAES